MLGDIAANFRAPLDYLAWELARKHLHKLGESRDPRFTQFPLTDSPDGFNDKRWQLKDIAAQDVGRIEGYQPYNRPPVMLGMYGRQAFALLRDLSNADKHRHLNLTLTRSTRFTSVSPGRSREEAIRLAHAIQGGWAAVLGEEVVEWLPEGNDPDQKNYTQATMQIVIREGDDPAFWPRLDWAMDEIAAEVLIVLRDFEEVFE